MISLHSMYSVCCLILTIHFTITPAIGHIVSHEPCRQSSGERYSIACTVHDVDVNPCPEAANGKPCKIKHGSNATITFNYTPEFSVATANSRAYWDQLIIDLPFIGMNTDACDFTTCPITSGTKQTYNYSLPILKTYPTKEYLVKWKLWNDEPDVNKMCCFKFRIAIVP